jgi:hypothetical protein
MILSGGKKPVIITNSINKTVLLPFCDNKVIEINRNQSLIVLQKYGSM